MSWWSFIKATLKGEHKPAGTTWGMLIFTVIYTLSPIDFIPELLLPIVGYIDDLGMWGVFIALAAREKSRYEVAVREGSAEEPLRAERLS